MRQWYLDRYRDLGEDTIVALVYEEFCLREEDDEHPVAAEYLARYPQVVGAARARCCEIHDLVGSGTPVTLSPNSLGDPARLRAMRSFRRPARRSAVSIWSKSWGAGRSPASSWPGSGSLPIGRWRSRSRGAARGSRRRSPGCSTRTSCRCTRTGSTGHGAASAVHALFRAGDSGARAGRPGGSGSRVGRRLWHRRLTGSSPAELLASPHSTGREALEKRTYPQAIAWWGARLAEALDHAHDRGVLHRDIKPSNVLVTADGMPMLLDFNLAREPVLEDESPGGEPTLGGTIDYMPPEQLKALAEGCFGPGRLPRGHLQSGSRAVRGAYWQAAVSPRRAAGGSMVDLLNRAADLTASPAAAAAGSPPRDPRLARDGDQAVPRARAGRPLPARVSTGRRSSGRRRRPAAAAHARALARPHGRLDSPSSPPDHRGGNGFAPARGVACRRRWACAWNRSNLLAAGSRRVRAWARSRSIRNVFSAAKAHFDTAENLAAASELTPWSYLEKAGRIRQIGPTLTSRIRNIKNAPQTAGAHRPGTGEVEGGGTRQERKQKEADALFEAADRLRFQLLLDEGSDLTQATTELQEVLAPFFVLENEDWTKLEHMMILLDADRRKRIVNDVYELLFLWMAAIDESAADSPRANAQEREELLETAVATCEKALVWAEPKAPWRALLAGLRAQSAGSGRDLADQTERGGPLRQSEPRLVSTEKSALACFQWGILAYRDGRLARAIEWLERASRLEEGSNYWYQFLLGYLEDKDGRTDDAFSNYTIACALKPGSAWPLFSRARIYRARRPVGPGPRRHQHGA